MKFSRMAFPDWEKLDHPRPGRGKWHLDASAGKRTTGQTGGPGLSRVLLQKMQFDHVFFLAVLSAMTPAMRDCTSGS
jgi:hypothetical protein